MTDEPSKGPSRAVIVNHKGVVGGLDLPDDVPAFEPWWRIIQRKDGAKVEILRGHAGPVLGTVDVTHHIGPFWMRVEKGSS